MRNERTIPNNKPDIIICDNIQGTCTLIDVAIPGDRNMIKKEAEKILKYKVLIIEIQCLWNVRSEVIPVLTGATKTISKSLTLYPSNIRGKQKNKLLQKTAILRPTHFVGKVLM